MQQTCDAAGKEMHLDTPNVLQTQHALLKQRLED